MTAKELLDLLPSGDDVAADDAAADCVDAWFSEMDDAPAVPPGGLERLLRATKSPARFAGATDALASLFDVKRREAEMMLRALDSDDEEWVQTLEGIRVRFAAGGPGLGVSIASFLEVSPGTRFPLHDHDSVEVSLMLQGACREDDGTVFGAGDTIVRHPGEAHAFTALGKRPAIFALKSGGLEFIELPSD